MHLKEALIKNQFINPEINVIVEGKKNLSMYQHKMQETRNNCFA